MALCTLLSLVTGACLLGSIAAQSASGVPTLPPGTTYRWAQDPWSDCSRTCDGTQTRRVFCEGTQPDGTKIEVDDDICDREDERVKPLQSRSCGVECPVETFDWLVGPYGDCSSVCGPGTRSRQVVCQKQVASIISNTTDEECLSNGKAPKPQTMDNCVSACNYGASDWSDCTVTCGGGTRTRTVFCTKTHRDGTQETVDISHCDNDPVLGARPDGSEPCNTDPCCTHRWRTEAFTPCSRTCDGTQTRRVYCSCDFPNATSAGEAPDAVCEATAIALKPIANRSCGEECETYSWSVGEWGTCSAECGPGIERRTVTCEKATLSSTTTVDDSECISRVGSRPSRTRGCSRVCQCVPSPWGPCNVSCGCGQQTRTFSCLQNTSGGGQVTVAFRHCEIDPTQLCEAQEQRQCEERCYEWDLQAWGACSTLCGLGDEERDVPCMREGCDGVNRVDDAECRSQLTGPKPDTTRQCDPECEYDVTEWSPCSRTCGEGFQVRTISCLKILISGSTEVIDIDNCNSDSTISGPRPPPTIQDCVGPICPIPPKIRDPPTRIPPDYVPPKEDVSYFIGQAMYAIDGYKVSVDCTEIQANPLAEMVFELPDGTTLAPGESVGRFSVQRYGPRNITLIIDNVETSDQGNYRCVAQNSIGGVTIGNDSADSYLTVYIPPKIRDPPTRIPSDYVPPKEDVSYFIGQAMYAIDSYKVSVDCTEIQADPLADMVFELPDGTTLAPGESVGRFSVQRYGPRNITLIIDNVKTSDQGNYRCVAQNSVGGVTIGTDSADSYLTVYTPPVITDNSTTVNNRPVPAVPIIAVAEDNNVEFACAAAIGNPPPDVKWFVGDIEITTGGRFVVQADHSLLIRDVQASDENEYRCEARNIVGQDDSSVSLRVEALEQTWQLIAGPCSHSCGSHGSHVIGPQCIRDSDNTRVDDSLCSGQKPIARRDPCNRIPCPARWATGPYSPCSSTCTGEQIRDVYCQQEQADGRTIIVADDVCERDDLRLKPQDTRTCGVECRKYKWREGTYSDCSTLCGHGIQVREVLCVREIAGREERADDEDCINSGEPKPPISRSCDPINECYYNITEWSSCSTTCGLGVQTRTVTCIKRLPTGDQPVPLDECTRDPTLFEPTAEVQCFQECFCVLPRWQFGDWSPCPASCGSSTATENRHVYCMCFDSSPPRVIADSECSRSDKPDSSRNCGRGECPCVDHYWRRGPYDPCSPTCGDTGVKKRKVDCVCFKDGVRQIADPNQCDQSSKPVDTKDCYPPSCPCVDPRWAEGPWGSCSKTCNGIQTRTVNCVCNNNTVHDGYCIAQLPIPKPDDQRTCLGETCPCIKHFYKVSSWTSCSLTCGEGVQTRRVACYCARENIYEKVEEKDVCEDAIAEPFPKSEQPCYTPCPCENLTYITGPWTPCTPDECYGYQNRSLSCYCDGIPTDIRNCDFKFLRRPPETRRCHHCPFIWQPGPWSTCDATCHRRRAVSCKNSETGERFPRRYCLAHSTMARPHRTERCKYEGNKTKVTWEVTAWSPCSKPCTIGSIMGVKRRTVTCVNQCLRVKAEGCNAQRRPRHLMQCNYFPCDTTQCKDIKGWDCAFAHRNSLCNEPEWNYRCCASCATGQ